MVSSRECQSFADECVKLSSVRGTPLHIATVLMGMARCWTMLSTQTERYHRLVASEATRK
jgi:hypothetical protein